jgi:hypothetical protein
MKIWIVFGRTGEYSDRDDWPVDAWPSQEAAEARVEQLTRKYQEVGFDRLERWDGAWEKAVEAFRADPDGDPGFRHDYTGTDWTLGECTLRGFEPPHQGDVSK